MGKKGSVPWSIEWTYLTQGERWEEEEAQNLADDALEWAIANRPQHRVGRLPTLRMLLWGRWREGAKGALYP